MNKYINTDRLLTEIERLYAENKVEWKLTGSSYHEGAMDMLDKIEQLIDYLQQEQESVAERFARIVRENLTGIDEEVQQKFEQLYFEVTRNKMYGGYID